VHKNGYILLNLQWTFNKGRFDFALNLKLIEAFRLGRSNAPVVYVKQIEFDNWSIWLEIKILIKTFGVVLNEEDSY